jgi:two-component system, cell cycle sensor histidine kinase and response regulator CckA
MVESARPLRVLIVEDREDDAALAVRALTRNGFEVSFARVETGEELSDALRRDTWQLVLCDHGLPQLRTREALQILQAVQPDVPFIVLSGTIGEEAAVEALKAGAADVVVKGNMDRLGPVTERELRAAASRRRHDEAEAARRENEVRTSAILESALDSIITIDGDGLIVEFNRTAEETFGRTRADVLGRPMAELLIPPALRGGHTAGLARYLQTGVGRILNQRVELTAMRADGTEFPVEVAVVPVHLTDTTVFTGYVRDITDRQYLQQQLNQSQRLESLGQLAGGIAHDFNNLLSVIANYADFVAETLDEPDVPGDDRWVQARDDVAAIRRASDRAAALVRQLMAFARREVVRPQVLDLDEVVAETSALLHRTIGDRIELRARPTPGLWRVRVDRAQLEQVLVNLAVNARDAMLRGGRLTIDTANETVDARTAAREPGLTPGDYVRLRVRDTGDGMTAEVVARAFEPFFTTKPSGEGTGLGLATVYGIVTQAGGHAHIESAPGEGTTFTALLPAVDSGEPGGSGPPASSTADPDLPGPAAPGPAAPEPTAAPPVPSPDLTAPRETTEITETTGPTEARASTGAGLGRSDGPMVLVVDDEEPIRRLSARILLRHGYRVVLAEDGARALAILRDRGPEITALLTDITMPRMDGHELAARVGILRPDVHVVYMSGHVKPDAHAGRTLVEKPFSAADLVGAIDRTLAVPPQH